VTIPIHGRLVAALRALGATDASATRTTRFTVLRLEVMFARGDDGGLTTRPAPHPRYWLVGRAGALCDVYGRSSLAELRVTQPTIKRHLLATVPDDSRRQ